MVAMANPSIRRAPEPVVEIPSNPVVIYPSKKAARKRTKLKSEVPAPKLAPVVVLDPAPSLARAVSICGVCDVCRKRTDSRGVTIRATHFDERGDPTGWATAMREIADGDFVPDEFRVFLCELAIFPTMKKIVDRGRECWDIWPIPDAARRKERADMPVEKLLAIPLNVSRWLCPDCWREIEEVGVNQWLFEELDASDREMAESYAARTNRYAPLEDDDSREPSYAEDFQEQAFSVGSEPESKPSPLEPEDTESIRREVIAYCTEHGLAIPPMP